MNSDTSHVKWSAWVLRPIVVFAAVYTIVGILHECAHAVTAYVFKVPFTLFHWNVSLVRTAGTLGQRGLIALSGPLFCLILGLGCWLLYRRRRSSRSGLWLLYFTMFGVGTFFGNLISTAFVGDFRSVALALHLPMAIRYGASVTGALLICGLTFFVGMELRRWAPHGASGVTTMFGMVILPAALGTALEILILLPIPWGIAVGRMGEALFWVAGAVGALISRKSATKNVQSLSVNGTDFAVLLVAIVVIRVMAIGFAFVP